MYVDSYGYEILYGLAQSLYKRSNIIMLCLCKYFSHRVVLSPIVNISSFTFIVAQ